jgi:fermentation-respiration switch protein FrsA (DUF1100 family)
MVLTGRGRNEHSTNRRLTRGDSLLIGFDAFHLVDRLMIQPLQLILAENLDGTGFDESGKRLWDLASNPVDRTVIKDARHYEMYDVPEYVDAAVDRLRFLHRPPVTLPGAALLGKGAGGLDHVATTRFSLG